MTLLRRVLVVGAVAVLVAQPSHAAAETLLRADAVGDVARSPVGSSVYAPWPARIEGDITSTRVQHGRRDITIRIRMRDLSTVTNGNFHRLTLKSDRRIRTITIDAFPGHWEGRAVIRNFHGVVVGCAISHGIDYVGNVVSVRVPRACLGRGPRWVRVGVKTTVAGSNYAYADDAVTSAYSVAPVLGPRVRR